MNRTSLLVSLMLAALMLERPRIAGAQETPDAGLAEVEPAPEPEAAPVVAPAPAPATSPPATTTSTPAPRTPAGATPASSEPTTARRTAREPEEVNVEIPAYSRRIQTEEEEEAKPQDDTFDFLWIELAGGVSYVDLRAIDTTNFYPMFVRLSGFGGAGSLALGFRVDFLSVGVRASLAHYGDDFDVGTAVAEVSLAIPIPVVRPFIRAGFGFAWHGDSDFMAPDMSATTVFGWVFNAGVGVDIYLANWFSIGVVVSADILNMSRQSFEEEPAGPTEVMFSETGDAVGAQGRAMAGIAVHF